MVDDKPNPLPFGQLAYCTDSLHFSVLGEVCNWPISVICELPNLVR